MKNYGKADCLVEVADKVPFLKKENRIFNFELSAHMWKDIIKTSAYFKPLLMEHLADDNNSMEVLYPEKRKYYINNLIYTKYGDLKSKSIDEWRPVIESEAKKLGWSELIVWKPLQMGPSDANSKFELSSDAVSDNLGIIKEIAKTYPYKSYQPDPIYDSSNPDSGHYGRAAIWDNCPQEAQSAPNDLDKIKSSQQFIDGIIGDLPDGHVLADVEVNENAKKLPQLYYVHQLVALDGLFYGIESEVFLSENQPFWVNIKRTLASPTGVEHETLIIISIGVGAANVDGSGSSGSSGSSGRSGSSGSSGSDTPDKGKDKKAAEGGVAQEYDLILRNNSKPELIDYWFGRNGDKKAALEANSTVSDSEESGGYETAQSAEIPPVNRTLFSKDLSRILREKKDIEIGFMTVAGRLVIFVNDIPLVYTRLNPFTGKLMEAKIANAPIRVYGTNSQMGINACAMTFAPLTACAFCVPALRDGKGEPLVQNDGTPLKYQRVDEIGTFLDDPLVYLPAEPESKIRPLFGCDCHIYKDDNGEIGAGGEIKGFGFHQNGYVMFQNAGPAPRNADGGESGFDYWVLQMAPNDIIWSGWDLTDGQDAKIVNGGTPYFFRLRGASIIEEEEEPEWEDISEDTISISQNDSLENDYTMNIKKLDLVLYNKGGKYDYLRNEQRVIRVSWSWCEFDYTTTFTGITLSANIAETPGKELININCQDATWVLKQMPIISSPFFDGMYSYAAIEYLLKMAGIFEMEIEHPLQKAYWLSSGYGINDPRVKFDPSQTLFECIQTIADWDQSQVYFDGSGKVHLKRIPGGLFFDTGNLVVDAEFTRNPNNPGNKIVILDQKDVQYNNTSTINQIRILTVDRKTSLPVFYMVNAESAGLNPPPNPNALLFRKTYYRYEAAFGSRAAAKLAAHDLAKRMFYPNMTISFTVVGFDDQIELKTLAYIQVDGDSYRVTSVKRDYSADTNDYKTEITADWLFGTQPGFGG